MTSTGAKPMRSGGLRREQPGAVAPSRDPPSGSLETQLLARFTAEIKASAVSCSVLLTLHAAHLRGLPAQLPPPHVIIVPYIPMTVAAIAATSFAEDLPDGGRAISHALPYFLALTKTEMEHVMFTAPGSPDVFMRAIAAAISPLQSASKLLLLALGDLAALARSGTTTPEADAEQRKDIERIRADLAGALHGGTPLLRNGVVTIPATDIATRGVRRAVDFQARLDRGPLSWRVRVHNISQGGCGISGAMAIASGDCATLVIDTGRKLGGTIRWTDGQKAGFMFADTLLIADPLINQ